jgi:hypothetical protein
VQASKQQQLPPLELVAQTMSYAFIDDIHPDSASLWITSQIRAEMCRYCAFVE